MWNGVQSKCYLSSNPPRIHLNYYFFTIRSCGDIRVCFASCFNGQMLRYHCWRGPWSVYRTTIGWVAVVHGCRCSSRADQNETIKPTNQPSNRVYQLTLARSLLARQVVLWRSRCREITFSQGSVSLFCAVDSLALRLLAGE